MTQTAYPDLEGHHVTHRLRIEIQGPDGLVTRYYHRKVWSNGFIDHYTRGDSGRHPITAQEWDDLTKVHHVIRGNGE